jgi:VIT1/CCC1 family predicted Fe2+/Mn2+ transporter
MKGRALFRGVLSVLAGLAIGVIFAALVNLVVPSTNLTWTMLPVCLTGMAAGLTGYLIGSRKSAPFQNSLSRDT